MINIEDLSQRTPNIGAPSEPNIGENIFIVTQHCSAHQSSNNRARERNNYLYFERSDQLRFLRFQKNQQRRIAPTSQTKSELNNFILSSLKKR